MVWKKDSNREFHDPSEEAVTWPSEYEKEKLFPGGVTDTIGIELKDFADAIRYGNKPEVDGIEGFKDQAICMAAFESSCLNQPVSIRDIEDCKIENYQREINDALGV